MHTPHEILKQYWNYDSFREHQEEIIQSVLDGKDTLALLPTGGGKSICFQVPALCKEGICLVVSPLIALMKDQVDQLNKRGIKAFRISSDLNKREIDIILDNCIYGKVRFLYVSPERLKTDIFLERFRKMNVNLIAVDEAHCISQWGFDFRPPYREIAEVRLIHADVPIIAVTATATEQVVIDIQEKLTFKEANVFRSSFERSNLAYVVMQQENKYAKLQDVCDNVVGTGIVYANSRKRTKEVADYLHQKGYSVDFFHAGLPSKEKIKKQDDWIHNRTRIIVCTNAFGMGIDKPDVRFVVHMDIPNDIESYFQEAGRGGRDGKKSFAVILYNQQDILELDRRVESKYPPMDAIKLTYRALSNHLQVPIGTGLNSVHEFQIMEFANKYNFKFIDVFNAIKLLQQAEYLAWNESTYNPSRLMLLTDRKTLYNFELSHPQLDPMIKFILRNYEGVFDVFVKMDEALMSRGLGIPLEKVYSQLSTLQKQGILVYFPMNDKPKLIFLQERIDEKNLYFDKAIYRERKKSDVQRKDFIKNYVLQKKCRSLVLRNYFQDMEAQECGVCDVCLEKKKLRVKGIDFNLLEKEVLGILKTDPMDIESLIRKIDNAPKNEVVKIVRWLLDTGEVVYGDDHWLHVVG